MSVSDSPLPFSALGLSAPVLKALEEVGYEQPSPIQAETIPYLLEGHDLLGQAQTGTGKTAAFALPALSKIDLSGREPQVLVLAPTRELAIQVAEAFQKYAHHMKGFHVLPIYGGQPYDTQLRQLKRGVHVVVGTPGRVMDHMRRGTLRLNALKTLVLDEADEMLRMGFIDDVEWVLEQTPADTQVALFSATMPDVIRKVAQRHLKQPKEIKITKRTTTAATIRQRYWPVSGLHKLDALTRILEIEPFDAMLVFVRTKNATVELAERLSARGHACEALNGDIPQAQRERTVERLRKGQIDILVGTDVVARGLDVERISHVLNYDIPLDTEAYVHRIGRTGRAGRTGDAILFVGHREKHLLRSIERSIGQPIEPMQMPSTADINEQRVIRFKQRIQDTLMNEELEFFYQLLEDFQKENDVEPLSIAAALARLVQGDDPLLVSEKALGTQGGQRAWEDRPSRGASPRHEGKRGSDKEKQPPSRHARPLKDHPEVQMERYRLAVGYQDGVKPGNIVGAVANEAKLDSDFIGQIDIYDDFSTIDLPANMPKESLQALKKAWVCQRRLDIQPFGEIAKGSGIFKSQKKKDGKHPKRKAK